jgi:hypothetical protein
MIFRRRDRAPARQRVERYDGWWQPVPASSYPNVGGKIEWDAFASGDSEIELFAAIPGLPDGSEVVVRWGVVEVMAVVSNGGVVKRDLETKHGDSVPRLAGQQVELHHEGIVIARTTLEA